MKKKFLVYAVVLAILPASSLRAAEEPPSPRSGPAITFAETVFDAGETWEGEVVAHTFTFTNTGDADLKITRVRTTCGCTASNLSSDTIAPGENGEIRASFNTRNYRGRRSQPVYVHSNDPEQPTVHLRIEADVKAPAAFSPPNLQFGQVVRGQGGVRSTLLVFDGDPIPVREVSAQPDFFTARIVEDAGGDGGVRIEVEISPEAPVGRHRGALVARLDHPRVAQVTGRLLATVEGPLQYQPRLLFFNEADRAEGTVKTVSIAVEGERKAEIREASIDLPQFEVEVRTVRPGREFEAAVRLRPEIEPGRYAGALRIETDLPEEGAITVPLRANIGQ